MSSSPWARHRSSRLQIRQTGKQNARQQYIIGSGHRPLCNEAPHFHRSNSPIKPGWFPAAPRPGYRGDVMGFRRTERKPSCSKCASLVSASAMHLPSPSMRTHRAGRRFKHRHHPRKRVLLLPQHSSHQSVRTPDDCQAHTVKTSAYKTSSTEEGSPPLKKAVLGGGPAVFIALARDHPGV